MNEQYIKAEYISSKEHSRRLELFFFDVFWFGLLLYSIGTIIASSTYLSVKSCQFIEAIGLVLIFLSACYLIRPKINSTYLKVLFTIYILWIVVILVRINGYTLNYDFFKLFLFGDEAGGVIYLVPIVLLFPWNFTLYKRMFDIIILFGILYLFLDILFIQKLIRFGEDKTSQALTESLTSLSIPSGFILLTLIYHSSKRKIIAFIILASTLLFTIIRARRGLIFITSSILIFSFLFYFFHSKKKMIAVYFCILIGLLSLLYGSRIYHVKENKILGFLSERGTEDTRTGVELFFYDDMKINDWIVGRGVAGEYFCPDIEEDQLTNYRDVIETGYLQLILKGGLINLGLLLLITIPAFIQGVFFSNNILSKAAGIWILQFLIDLYPQNSVSFNLTYFIVWMSIGICYSKKIRKMSDDEMQLFLK